MGEETYYDVIFDFDDDSRSTNERFNTYEEAVNYSKYYTNQKCKIVKITIKYDTLVTVIPRSYKTW